MAATVIRNFIAKALFKKKGAIANNKSVDFSANALEERLRRVGIDPNAIQNENQLNEILAAVKQAEDQAFDARFGNMLGGSKFDKQADVLDMTGKKIDSRSKIMGGQQAETEAEILARINKENKKGIANIKNKMTEIDEAIDNASPGFAGDRKYDAQLVADDLAEKRFGKDFYDLDQKQQMDLYDESFQGLSDSRFKNKPDPEDMATGGRAGYKFGIGPLFKFFNKKSPYQAGKDYLKNIKDKTLKANETGKFMDLPLAEVGIPATTGALINNQLRKKLEAMNEEQKEQNLKEFIQELNADPFYKKNPELKDKTIEAYTERMFGEKRADGGRIGYKIGSIDKARRAFLKTMGVAGAGITALKTGLLGFGKSADAVKNIPPIKTPVTKLTDTTTQMPDWFPSFVNKFRDQGKAENVFKTKKVEVSKEEFDQAFKEGKGENYYTDVARTPEYKANNPDHMDYFKRVDTDELLYTKYTNEKIPGVQVDDMNGQVDVVFENDYSQPISINYVSPGKKGPDTGRPDLFRSGDAKQEIKPKGDFAANDVEVYATDPDGGFDTEDIIVDTLDDMMEGKTRQMEEFATGKKVKNLSRGEGRVIEAEIRAEQASDAAAEAAAEAADEFASGGIARMLGE